MEVMGRDEHEKCTPPGQAIDLNNHHMGFPAFRRWHLLQDIQFSALLTKLLQRECCKHLPSHDHMLTQPLTQTCS